MKYALLGLWTRLRFASVGQLGLSSALALVASIALDKVGLRGSEFLVGILLGLAVGLGILACGVWQRRRARA